MSIRRGRSYAIDAWPAATGRIIVYIGRQAFTLSVEEASDLRVVLESAVRKAVESEARIRAAYIAARSKNNE